MIRCPGSQKHLYRGYILKGSCSCCFLPRSTRPQLCYVRRHPSISSTFNFKYGIGTMLKPSSHYHDSTKARTIPEVYINGIHSSHCPGPTNPILASFCSGICGTITSVMIEE